AGTTAGAALPVVKVDVFDAYGNPVNGATVALNVSGTGSLTATAVSANGVASFSGLVLAQPGTYTLAASYGTLPAVAARAVNVAPNPDAPTGSSASAPPVATSPSSQGSASMSGGTSISGKGTASVPQLHFDSLPKSAHAGF